MNKKKVYSIILKSELDMKASRSTNNMEESVQLDAKLGKENWKKQTKSDNNG